MPKKEVTKEEARWYSDKQTLDAHFSKWKRNDQGFLIKDTKAGCIEKRVLMKNSDRWVKIQNKTIQLPKQKELYKQHEQNGYSDLKIKVMDFIFDKKRDDATELIVEFIENNYFIYTTKDDIKSEMWIYKGGVYKPEGKSEIKELIRKILGKVYNSNISNRIIEKIEADTFIEHDKFFQTNYLEEVPVENGILNIFTKELSDFNPKKIFFNKLPVKYIPGAVCPNILQFFADVLKDQDDVVVMLELFGFALLKEYKIEKAVMFVGKGRNGKSKTLELLKRFMDNKNGSGQTMSLCKGCHITLGLITASIIWKHIKDKELKKTIINNLIDFTNNKYIINSNQKFNNHIFEKNIKEKRCSYCDRYLDEEDFIEHICPYCNNSIEGDSYEDWY